MLQHYTNVSIMRGLIQLDKFFWSVDDISWEFELMLLRLTDTDIWLEIRETIQL